MLILCVFPCQDFSFRRGESDERRRHIPSEIGTAMRYPSYLERGPDYEAEMRYYTGDSLTSPHGRVRSFADQLFLEIIIIPSTPKNRYFAHYNKNPRSTHIIWKVTGLGGSFVKKISHFFGGYVAVCVRMSNGLFTM